MSFSCVEAQTIHRNPRHRANCQARRWEWRVRDEAFFADETRDADENISAGGGDEDIFRWFGGISGLRDVRVAGIGANARDGFGAACNR